MSDESYDGDDFESQPQPGVAATSTPTAAPAASTSKPPSRDGNAGPPLALPNGPTSPLGMSNAAQLSNRSTSTSRSVSRGVKPAKSPSAGGSAVAAGSKKKNAAAALLEGASNPAVVIQQLQEWNDQLTTQLTAQTAQLQSQQRINSELETVAAHHARALDDVNTQLQSVNATHSALKATHTGSLLQLAKLEAANVDLLAATVKEKNQCIELDTRLQKCEAALRREREDCARLKADLREREVQAKVEREQWEQEQAGWRANNVDLLTRIEALDDAIKHHKQTEQKLQHVIHQSTQLTQSQQTQLASLNDQLLTAVRRANDHADSAQAAQSSISHLEEQLELRIQRVLELEQSGKEQAAVIRSQSERINSVVFQMGRMDSWRTSKAEQEREQSAVMIEMRGVVESQEKAMHVALASKERSDSMIGILEERLGKEGKRYAELKENCGELERSLKAVHGDLRAKESECDHLSIKLAHLSGKLSTETQLRAQEKHSTELLEKKFLDQKNELEALILEKQKLEDERIIKEEIARDLTSQLDALKKKDEFYKKIQDMLASSNSENSQSLLALLTASNEKFVRYTNPVTKGKLKTALLGPAGQRVKAALKRCDVDVKAVLDWCIEPQRLVDGLDGLFANMKQLRNVDAFSARRNTTSDFSTARDHSDDSISREEFECQLDLVNARNADLHQANARVEADKSKALMRLVALCAGPGAAKEGSGTADGEGVGGGDRVFMTELDGDGGEMPVMVGAGLESLVLSEMGLGDSHVGKIAGMIGRSRGIKEVDLRGNALGNASAVAMVAACLEDGNRVHMVDLQQNVITLDGLEEVALMVLKKSGQAGAAAGVNEEKTKPRIIGASLYRQGNVLLPVLQLRLSDKLLLVDFRFNRLQHLKLGSVSGESVKQLMKRVLLRVCRILNSIGLGSSESIERVDWDTRTSWMTDAEVDAMLTANAKRKEEEGRRKQALATSFDTGYTTGAVRRTSDLDQKNVNVRPVLPPPPPRRPSKVGGVGGLPRIGSREGKGGSRRGSGNANGKKEQEEMKVQEDTRDQNATGSATAAPGDAAVEQVEGAVDAAEDEYRDEEFADSRDTAAAPL